MNRRQLIKSIIGVAVATAIPAMPFVWRERSFAEIVTEWRCVRIRRASLQTSLATTLCMSSQPLPDTRERFRAEHGIMLDGAKPVDGEPVVWGSCGEQIPAPLLPEHLKAIS